MSVELSSAKCDGLSIIFAPYFFEISAKNNTNIDRMFDDFIKNIVANTNYNKRKTTPKENKTEKSIISSFWDCCCYRRR